MVRDKVRIRFRKAGDLRLVSHHDLMRCFERMLRRAGLPVHVTGGFHPKPRLVFALSLALGHDGADEVAELELDDEIPPEEVAERLRRQAPAGLDILSARRIGPKVGARVCRVRYRTAVPDDLAAALAPRLTDLLAAPDCWVERVRPRPRRFDLRPYLLDLRLTDSHLEIDLRVTPQGAARPEEVMALLGLNDFLAAGAVLERIAVELEDETTPTPEFDPKGSA